MSGPKRLGSFPGDPFLHHRLNLEQDGRRSAYLAPHSVFSSHRIDHGTRLLLRNLPPGEPKTFLDMGSGYGVLGLEVASLFPRARGFLVDRDLLAVEFSRRNADENGISSVEVAASLGYRDLPGGGGPFDWILANLPARAGEKVMEYFLSSGRKRLSPGGEIRIVVIAPLVPSVVRVARELRLSALTVASTRSHHVFAFRGDPDGSNAAGDDPGEEVYDRDCIQVFLPEALRLVRPSDLADEPNRLSKAVPLLASHLPEQPGEKILVFRSGYGLLPALALSRYRRTRVVAQDRDLLATAFTRKNCRAFEDRLQVETCLRLSELSASSPFDLILGELSPPVGPGASLLELSEARALLSPGGRALFVGLLKQWRDFLRRESRTLGITLRDSRGPVALFEMLSRQNWPRNQPRLFG